ncbi:MAG: formylglycine-generating enzyme family protein [Planctomycetes bacterium]|nr:formylglycine-generating enzyme family protein [Planctomycetota bacterium]
MLSLSCALLSLDAVAQSGRTTLPLAPVVLGQTAGFALGHPPSIAGNVYALLLSAPSWPQAVPVTLPGVVVNGLLRLDVNGLLVGAAGVLDASGRSAIVPMPVPNNPLLVGFSFDVQGVDIDAAGVFTLADNDIEIVVAAPPLASANMVTIAAGTFLMGSTVTPLNVDPYYNQPNAQPVHPVTITRDFWMGAFEVTQAEYQAVMGSNPSLYVGANLPVEQVSWNDAVAYCSGLTALEAAAGRLPSGYVYRLPTEAEWEYCCRAGTTAEYHYGSTLVCGQANFAYSIHSGVFCSSPGGVQPAVVGSYAANPWGLYDMHGNVWEWCLDASDASTNYPAVPVFDPYVSSGPYGVFRGGSWLSTSDFCRSAFRGVGNFRGLSSTRGFRVVCAPILP